jgi:hypothetical protein
VYGKVPFDPQGLYGGGCGHSIPSTVNFPR